MKIDAPLDERIISAMSDLDELYNRWWMRPFRRLLRRKRILIQWEMSMWVVEATRMREMLDQLAEDERTEIWAREQRHRSWMDQAIAAGHQAMSELITITREHAASRRTES